MKIEGVHIADAVYDHIYSLGFKAGWNSGMSEDYGALRSVSKSHDEARKLLKQRRKAESQINAPLER